MIALRELSRTFKGRRVFESGELEAAGPGLVALQGPNGSGKTTLLRILSTLTSPSSGEAWVNGYSIVSAPRRARESLGFVPAGDGGLFRRLTGRENLMLFGGLCGLGKGETARAIDRLREAIRLDDALSCPFGQASSGMRQKLVLARALIHDPQVLLLDEPARALDTEAKAALWSILRELAARKTILYSSHDQSEWSNAPQRWRIEGGVLSCSGSC